MLVVDDATTPADVRHSRRAAALAIRAAVQVRAAPVLVFAAAACSRATAAAEAMPAREGRGVASLRASAAPEAYARLLTPHVHRQASAYRVRNSRQPPTGRRPRTSVAWHGMGRGGRPREGTAAETTRTTRNLQGYLGG